MYGFLKLVSLWLFGSVSCQMFRRQGSFFGRIDPYPVPQPGHLPAAAFVPQTKIFNGRPVNTHKWPHHVAICIRDRVRCGGSIVSDLWVVTAAHCLDLSSNVADYKVIAGALRIRPGQSCFSPGPGELLLELEDISVHSNFGQPLNTSNDIAMLKLERPIDFRSNPNVKPIRMQHLISPIMSGEKCTAMGWGATGESNGRPSPVLQEVELEIQSHITCRRQAELLIPACARRPCFDYTMFCAGREDGGVDTCGGDSGGGVICEQDGSQVLAGITSWGISATCGMEGYGFYANMDRLLGFIDDTMNPQARITAVTVVTGRAGVPCPPGFTNRVPQNLNPDGPLASYICFQRSNGVDAITDIRMVSGRSASCPSGMRMVPTNMVKGVGSMFLCYTGGSTQPLRDVPLGIQGSNSRRPGVDLGEKSFFGGLTDIIALVTSDSHSSTLPPGYDIVEQTIPGVTSQRGIRIAVKSNANFLSKSLKNGK